MRTGKILIISAIALLALYGIMINGCSTDPIKSVKNDPEKMDIMMNHIANDDAFREKMVERMTTKGDKQKFAEKLCMDDDFNKTLLSKILEKSAGETDIIQRVANRKELITKAIERSLQMPELRETILDAILANAEMVEYLKTSEKLKTALESESPEKPADTPAE